MNIIFKLLSEYFEVDETIKIVITKIIMLQYNDYMSDNAAFKLIRLSMRFPSAWQQLERILGSVSLTPLSLIMINNSNSTSLQAFDGMTSWQLGCFNLGKRDICCHITRVHTNSTMHSYYLSLHIVYIQLFMSRHVS